MSNIPQGTATPQSQSNNLATVSARDSNSYNFPKVIPNPLEKFASYVPLWTLIALTPEQVNNPQLFRDKPPSASGNNVVFSSAGRNAKSRTVIGDPSSAARSQPEYFIDDVRILKTIASNEQLGNTNAASIEFNLYEPYSMGNFLESLQASAVSAGFINYLNNAPYLLQLDFVGIDNQGRNVQIRNLSRYFVVRLREIQFEVDTSGSVYRIKTMPYNYTAFSNLYSSLKKDIKISGSTVEEILTTGTSGLSQALTRSEQTATEEQAVSTHPDIYVIRFPDPSLLDPIDRLSSVNDIGKSSMGFSMSGTGNYSFSRETDVTDTQGRVVRDRVTIDPSNKVLQFGQGQSVMSIIEEVVITSEYGKKAIDTKKADNEGLINWFKIEPQIFIQPDKYDFIRNDYAKVIVFKVIPYKISFSKFQQAIAPGLGHSEIRKKIVKKYNYIYTGENTDMLDFKLKFNNSALTAVTAQPHRVPSNDATQSSVVSANPLFSSAPLPGSEVNGLFSKLGSQGVVAHPVSGQAVRYKPGGASADDVAAAVAKDLNQALLSSTDKIRIEFDIWGDPYFMVDSGLSNYDAPLESNDSMITEDGGMAYQTRQIFVYLSFKTALDVDEQQGTYKFQNNRKENLFSGIYSVSRVTSTFDGGVFKQTILCVRMPKQLNEYDDPPSVGDKGSSAVTTQGETTDAREDGGIVDPDTGSITWAIDPPSAIVGNQLPSITP